MHNIVTHYALESAYLRPEQEIYGSITIGRLDSVGNGVSIAAAKHFGQSQIGISVNARQHEPSFAVLFERSFGSDTKALAFIEAASADRDFVFGLNHRPNSSLEVDLSLLREFADSHTEIRLGLSFVMKGDRPARVAPSAGGAHDGLGTLRRNASTLRTARGEKLNAVWSEVLQ